MRALDSTATRRRSFPVQLAAVSNPVAYFATESGARDGDTRNEEPDNNVVSRGRAAAVFLVADREKITPSCCSLAAISGPAAARRRRPGNRRGALAFDALGCLHGPQKNTS